MNSSDTAETYRECYGVIFMMGVTRVDQKVMHNNFFSIGIVAGMLKFHRDIV